jgi:hypothetical protein
MYKTGEEMRKIRCADLPQGFGKWQLLWYKNGIFIRFLKRFISEWYRYR